MGTVLRVGPDRIAAPDDYCMLDLGKDRDRTLGDTVKGARRWGLVFLRRHFPQVSEAL